VYKPVFLYLPHPKPLLALNIPVNPDVYSSSINVPKHFAIVFYSKGKELPVLDRFRNWLYSGEATIFKEFCNTLELVSV
jgi:hypothetical protein